MRRKPRTGEKPTSKKYGAGTEFSPSKDEGVGVDLGSDGLSSGKLGGLRTN